MKYKCWSFRLLLISAYFIVVLSKNAYAYLDPGTGSFILQIVIAALLAAAVTVKLWWKRLISFVLGIFSKNKRHGTDDK